MLTKIQTCDGGSFVAATTVEALSTDGRFDEPFKGIRTFTSSALILLRRDLPTRATEELL